ncbi:MAG TPA: DUF3300 domain-containing protein [Verrucomicrobiae bacterium]
MRHMAAMAVGLAILLQARAQDTAPPLDASDAAAPATAFAPEQLQQLVGPIALYPDPLIAELLPAAGFPSEIVQADRYVSQGGDINQVAGQGWDPSVQALAHYANVLKWMDDNLTWTTQLGQAFEGQQADVMNAIQQLRGQAQNLGNLPSTPQETVDSDNGDIEIEPVDPDQMYVPSYPVDQIYVQPGVVCAFPFWVPVGGWLVHDWNWHDHGLVFWGAGHPRPGNWWHETPVQRHSYIVGHQLPVWHGGGGGIARGGLERGYEPRQVYRSYAATPRGVTPGVSVIHDMPKTFRNVPAFHRAPAPAPAPASRGFFVGGQSGREAVESSQRGQESRGEIRRAAPAPREASPAPRQASPAPRESGGYHGGGAAPSSGGGGKHR